MRRGAILHIQAWRKNDFEIVGRYFSRQFGFVPTKSQIVAYSIYKSAEWFDPCADAISKTGTKLVPFPYPAQVFAPRYIDVQVNSETVDSIRMWSRKMGMSMSYLCSFALFHTARALCLEDSST